MALRQLESFNACETVVGSKSAKGSDKGPVVALMEAGLTGGTAAADGEFDVVIAGGGISTCRDMAESMYGGNSSGCTIVEGAD
ncbi:hypothetical protein LWI28_023241 [Acer negundo]|uniref:Uncharacterized protein n=1 Tax=Acer negundo TaxID=4023 RepID=A0AAD5J188_ACENE|nr:hypothetical protein LWI28_023241 [Acer negundo]